MQISNLARRPPLAHSNIAIIGQCSREMHRDAVQVASRISTALMQLMRTLSIIIGRTDIANRCHGAHTQWTCTDCARQWPRQKELSTRCVNSFNYGCPRAGERNKLPVMYRAVVGHN